MEERGSKVRIIREAGIYGVGTIAAQVVSAVRGLVIAGMLGPSSYGLWKSLQVGLDYLGYTHLGVLHGMSRKLPLARSVGATDEARVAMKIGLGMALLSSFLTGCLVIAWTWSYPSPLRELWGGIAGLLILGQLIRFLAMRCQADGRLGVLSAAELTWAIVSFAAMLALVPSLGVLGVLLGMGAGFSTAIAMAWYFGIFPSWHDLQMKEDSGSLTRVFKELLTTGFPFMFVDGLFVVWQRVDLLVLVYLFGGESEEVGWYGLATMVASFAIQVPQIQMRVLFRRTLSAVSQANGEKGLEPGRLKHFLELPVLAIASTTPLLFGLGTALTWFLIRWFLPDYLPSVPNVALLMLACYWSAVGIAIRNLYTALNRQWTLALIYGVAILATVSVILVMAEIGKGVYRSDIRIGAFGMLAGSACFANLALWDTSRLCGYRFGERARLLFVAWGPFAFFAIWTWVAGAWTASPPAETTATSWMSLGGDIATCLLLTSPAALIGVWKLMKQK